MIIAVEGIDGAGKNTLVNRVREAIGMTVEVRSFPQYDTSIHAQLVQKALHGQMGDLADSAYAMATLFALDRRSARDQLLRYAPGGEAEDELLILDRYVASNAAYSWARTGDEQIVRWVEDLEFGSFALPVPDLHVLLATDPEEAARRARTRESLDESRARDTYEKDGGLQSRTFDAYLALARQQWRSPWLVTRDAEEVIAAVMAMRA